VRDVVGVHVHPPVPGRRAVHPDALLDVETVRASSGGGEAAAEDVPLVLRAAGGRHHEVEVIDQLDAAAGRAGVVGPDEGDDQRLGRAVHAEVERPGPAGLQPRGNVVRVELPRVPVEEERVVEADASPPFVVVGDVPRRHVAGAADEGGLDQRRAGQVPRPAGLAERVVAVHVVLPHVQRASGHGGRGHRRPLERAAGGRARRLRGVPRVVVDRGDEGRILAARGGQGGLLAPVGRRPPAGVVRHLVLAGGLAGRADRHAVLGGAGRTDRRSARPRVPRREANEEVRVLPHGVVEIHAEAVVGVLRAPPAVGVDARAAVVAGVERGREAARDVQRPQVAGGPVVSAHVLHAELRLVGHAVVVVVPRIDERLVPRHRPRHVRAVAVVAPVVGGAAVQRIVDDLAVRRAGGFIPGHAEPAGVVVHAGVHDREDLAFPVQAMVPDGGPAARVGLHDPGRRVVAGAELGLLLDPPDVGEAGEVVQPVLRQADDEPAREAVIGPLDHPATDPRDSGGDAVEIAEDADHEQVVRILQPLRRKEGPQADRGIEPVGGMERADPGRPR